MLDGKAGEDAGIERVAHAARRDDDPHGDSEVALDRAGFVHDDLDCGGDAAHERCVTRGIDLQLEPYGALGEIILGGLAKEAAHNRLAVDDGACGVVEALEAEPAARARLDLERGLFGERARQPQLLCGRELLQRVVTHRAREVQVQVRLGQRAQVSRAFAIGVWISDGCHG